jgi:hypothetical protein
MIRHVAAGNQATSYRGWFSEAEQGQANFVPYYLCLLTLSL